MTLFLAEWIRYPLEAPGPFANPARSRFFAVPRKKQVLQNGLNHTSWKLQLGYEIANSCNQYCSFFVQIGVTWLMRSLLARAAWPLATLVMLLSQVLATAMVSDPNRELREQDDHANVLPDIGVSSSPSLASSPAEYPNKRFRKD
ncbi:uncharacterized protein RAG0_16655 [Rhynchosporium agropyri]|uniref:Uncharacterized protein n=1 Tax=Rhynchosporium agropyri TaxID=914238 RepID=A0A1E1LRC6_9HELO|nr:uncharacterized protein RAG0_16655 [Rhynchosporium agropyri]